MSAPLLQIEDLAVDFLADEGVVQAVRGVSFAIETGQTVALVGESGSGKTVISQAILGILPQNARISRGRIVFRDPRRDSQPIDLASYPDDHPVRRSIRGGQISIIFQEPMSSLSPLHTIGDQIIEAVLLHTTDDRAQGKQRTIEMLAKVGFPDPEQAFRTYPFELSGGLRQRAMIAMALACDPALLIADEPTTALDVTIQAQILGRLQALLEGRDPTSWDAARQPARRPHADGNGQGGPGGGRVRRHVLGARSRSSVWWALTGDPGLLEAHDVAVRAALEHLERYGATTRVRVNGRRQHPDTLGLTMAVFRQATSRDDDPQLHTHAVISAKVQTPDGRWWALDARYLKRNQRMLGGLYQSVLRAELTHRYGVAWEPIVNGQAEIAGMPAELLAVFSKRTAQVDAALAVKVDEFREREGRDPTRWERAALSREAAGRHPGPQDRPRCRGSARHGGRPRPPTSAGPRDGSSPSSSGPAGPSADPAPVTVDEVIDGLSASRVDVDPRRRPAGDLRPRSRPCPRCRDTGGRRRSSGPATGSSTHCVDLDPPGAAEPPRASDGRSVWLEPTAPHLTSERDPRPGGTDPGLGASTPRPTTRSPSHHRRRRRARRAAGRRRRRGRRRRPARAGGRAGRHRQDHHPATRRRRPRRPATGRCSAWPPPPRRPGSWPARPACPPTPSPSSSTSGIAPTGHP